MVKNPHTTAKGQNHPAKVSVMYMPISVEAARVEKPIIQRFVIGIFVCQGLP